jgi:hypothetical protein
MLNYTFIQRVYLTERFSQKVYLAYLVYFVYLVYLFKTLLNLTQKRSQREASIHSVPK